MNEDFSLHNVPHISDPELIQAADGELSNHRAREIQSHLEACWSCRSRRAEIEKTIAKFVESYEGKSAGELPSIDAARFRLESRLAEVSAISRPTVLERVAGFISAHHRLVYAGSGIAAVLLGYFAVRFMIPPVHAAPIPNARLTPGAARSVSREEICKAENSEEFQSVSDNVARRVFEEYGIRNPAPRTYEVDYLITPALGGSNDIRNLWPQPYAEGTWNSHVKDALEDRLRAMVCDGALDLETAQQEISSDWIAAYRKYFRTREPLEIHAGFALDRPWE